MNDAENLAKLLGHLKPELFRTFMADEFGVAMPAPEKKQAKTEQREAMAAVLAALPISEWQKIEEVIADTSKVPLDREMDHPVVDEIREIAETGADRWIIDLQSCASACRCKKTLSVRPSRSIMPGCANKGWRENRMTHRNLRCPES